MKKLLVMTLAVSAASVMMATDCAPPQVDDPDCATVYNVKFSGKTTVGRPVSKAEAAPLCEPDGGSSEAFLARIPGSLNIEGWVAYCDCDCDNVFDIENGESMFWATKPSRGWVDMSNNLSEQYITVGDTRIVGGGPLAGSVILDSVVTNTVDNNFIQVIGLKQNQAEISSVFGGTYYHERGDQYFEWTASALGAFNVKARRYTSFSGSFAGWMEASYSFVKKIPEPIDPCDQTRVWTCGLSSLGDAEDTVAFGSWSVRYNASASKAYAKGKPPKTPAWVWNFVK